MERSHNPKSYSRTREYGQYVLFHSLRKTPYFHLISWCENFVEKYSFRIVSGESPETMRKLCLSTKFPHQKIRWNYSILRGDCWKGSHHIHPQFFRYFSGFQFSLGLLMMRSTKCLLINHVKWNKKQFQKWT